MILIKACNGKCGKIISCVMKYLKNMGNDQKPAYLLNPIISKFVLFLLHDYHILQLIGEIHVIPDIAFSPHNIKVLPTHQLEFFWLVIPLNFFRER